ncbi:MAG: M48 family metalloprotease [Pyrinomonadaceae bacterium]
MNGLTEKENAYASTNFPFQLVTIYSDFYTKAADDTERAMVLMHEARHLMGENENQAYAYVWRHRKQLGWSIKTHGATESYVTIEQQTREMAPELFNCPEKPWEDCTE